MLTSRSLHFVILGVILGASAAYVLAFYRADVPIVQAALPSNHPAVGPDTVPDAAAIAALKEVAERNPSDATIWERYGDALLRSQRLVEAAAAFERVLQLRTDDVAVRSVLGAVYWKQGQMDLARKHLDAALKQDPRDILSLHFLFLLTLENDRDASKAEELLKRIESVDPDYRGLADLRDRLKQNNGRSGS